MNVSRIVGRTVMPDGVHVTIDDIKAYKNSLQIGDVFQCLGLCITGPDLDDGTYVKWRINKKYKHQCQLKLVRGKKVVYGYARYIDMYLQGDRLKVMSRQEDIDK